jgi:hypothetical protein
LEAVDLINVMCLAPPAQGKNVPTAAYRTALEYCVHRRAMLLVDPRVEWSQPPVRPSSYVSRAVSGITDFGFVGSNLENAALYVPFIEVADAESTTGTRLAAPSGSVAGVMARTDARQGVWTAPAGADARLLNASGFEMNLTDVDQGVLNPEAVNALRMFPGIGPVIWGGRTLAGSDQSGNQFKYISVRRSTLFVEESLFRGTQWAVFEPNGAPLWAALTASVTDFMHQLFQRGAFQGVTPEDAYTVRCDSTTTTAADIQAGVVNLLVGFAPLRPAEFIVLRIQQKAGRAPSPAFSSFVHQSRPAPRWEDLDIPFRSRSMLRVILEGQRMSPSADTAVSLFSGPSGTGKTMAAQLLANELHVDLYRIDLDGVVNTYVGETEKNLGRLFEEAAESGAILFFDEADALFGNRTEVDDTHDRLENFEVSLLLQHIGRYPGLVILDTHAADRWIAACSQKVHVVGFD